MCAVGLLAGAGAGQSGEQPDVRAVIDKGIKAQGGEANLSKQKAVLLKGSGKYYGLGEGIPYTGEWALQPPGQFRVAIEGKVNDQTFRMMRVVNGDKGWIKLNDGETKTMSKEEVAEQREELYAHQVANLVPLRDKAYQLAPLGESKVDGRDAIGVRVSRKDHRDVSLFFDKASGLLVKTETVVKDVEGGGDKEMTQEVFQSDFKEIDGVKHAMKTVLKRDGKLFVEVEWSEIRPAEKLDDSIFARP
jgi:outer membrane lipoprotein-sorting protein